MVKITRTSLYRPFLIFGIVLGFVVIIVDIVFVSFFYVQVKDEYAVLEDALVCPEPSAPLCCGALDYCSAVHNATTDTCIDEYDWSGHCCTRTDHVGFFFVVTVLFFFIFVLQIVDLLSKIVLYRSPTENKLVKAWELILNFANVGLASTLVFMSSRSSSATAQQCYSDPIYQSALATTVGKYKDLFGLSVVEVVFTSVLMVVDLCVLFNVVYPSESRLEEVKRKKTEAKQRKAEKRKSNKGDGRRVSAIKTNDAVIEMSEVANE
eukprot:m.44766 g.44766  ORF g.44766 m.44766 type:complete len:265 (-) comp10627_c0_seq1:259-1053(-)